MAKPILRWAGSKRQIVHVLAEYWPEDAARYVEPFAGSARLFFELEPHSSLLGDINSGLMEVYQVIRDRPQELHHALSYWVNHEDEYYRVRAMTPTSLPAITRVARFVYLNRFCFNGLYRTNRSGDFNVPYGGHKSGSLPSLADLEAASYLLDKAELRSADFAVVLEELRTGDFVYLDPPYTVRSRRVFREYDPASFGPSDLCRMRVALEEIDRIGATFVLSYADSVEGEAMADGFRCTRVPIRRNIAGFASHRRSTTELLVTNSDIKPAA